MGRQAEAECNDVLIPVGAFDAHWDAVGAGVHLGDLVNVIGTSTCMIGLSASDTLVPGVCGVVPGSVDPKLTGVEAGLSAVGDLFEAIARRAGSSAAALSNEVTHYRGRPDRPAAHSLGITATARCW